MLLDKVDVTFKAGNGSFALDMARNVNSVSRWHPSIPMPALVQVNTLEIKRVSLYT